ncbi:tetratricopeptide TPR_2, partial [Reticulomyxa filosa]
VYCALGIAYNGKGEYDKASDYHQQALEIQLKNVGDSHNDVASSYDSLGRVYCMKAEYDKAYEYHEKALNIYLKQLDENQIDVSLCYCHLGNVLRGKGEYVKSIEYDGLIIVICGQGENGNMLWKIFIN